MNAHEWCEKWCAEVDPAVRRAHMALKEAGYGYVLIDVVHTNHGHDHFVISWPAGQPDIPSEVELRAHRMAMLPEMYAEAVENGIIGGEPFPTVPVRNESG